MELYQHQEIQRISELIPLTKEILNIDNYQINNFCDALDENRYWCVGQIVERNDNILKVHFEGWSIKHDICVNVASKKITQFRQFTVGYTGQKNQAYRSQAFNEEQFKLLTELLKQTNENNFKNLNNAVEVTQVLRGIIFTNLDIFMTIPLTSSASQSTVISMAENLYRFLDLSITYLKFYKEHLFLLDLFLKHRNLYLCDTKIAIIASLYEIIITIRRIFARDDRTNRFYEVNFNYNF